LPDVPALIKARRFAEAEAEIRADLTSATAYRWLGRALEGQGRRNEAVTAWKQAVALGDVDAMHRLGLLFARAGNTRSAIAWFGRLTAVAPHRADAWTNLGVALRTAGRPRDAIAALNRALELERLPLALSTRGLLAADAGDPRAIDWLREAGTLTAEGWIALGRLLRRAGDQDGAEAAFRKALPDAGATVRLVRLLMARERLEAALEAAEAGRATHPTHPEIGRLTGILLGRLGRTAEAAAVFRECTRIAPEDAAAWANLASALWNTGAVRDTIDAAKTAVSLDPDLVLARHTLGVALEAVKDPSAIHHLEAAFALTPDDPVLRCDLAHAYRRESRLADAMSQYEAVLSLHPDHPLALSGAGGTRKDQGRASEAVAFIRRAHALRPADQAVWDNLLLSMHYDPGISAAEILDAHLDWGRDAETRPLAPSRPRKPGPIRIGYVSGDLGQHPVGAFLLGVFPAHDRREFRVHAYSTRANPDDNTRRFEAASDRWRDVTLLSETALLELILEDDIDVLVDLAGHTKAHRLGVFARRAARVQVSWAGYVGTTGLSRMDWLIGDRVHTPNDRESIEKIWRMPEGYVPYTPPVNAPEVGFPSRRGFVTFGCFNNVAKLSPPTIALWRRILEELPAARLLLLSHGLADAGVQAWFRDHFGPVAGRVEMRGRVGHKTLMRTYAEEVDIALDPFPYSGGVTSLEALWMGVPVVTLGGGDRFCSRHTSGHLTHIGEPETIAVDPDDYVRIAVQLARDEDRRVRERAERREKMRASPVLDSARFTRNLEDAFREMLRRT
jgi:protein O-GlcNAc transferase